MIEKRLAKLRALLKKEKLAACVVLVNEGNSRNVLYLSGFGGTTGALAVSKRGAALAVDGRYLTRAKREVAGIRIAPVYARSREGDLSEYVNAALAALGVPPSAAIGYEGGRVSVLTARSWEKTVSKKLVPTTHLVERLREVKDASEISALRDACRRTSGAFRDIAKNVKAGITERLLADLIERALKKRGALKPSFETIVASGPNSAIPHHATATRKLKAGEPVVIDFGGLYESGYCSDMTRTVFVPGKKPDQRLIAIYGYVLEANRRAAKTIRSGITFREYDGAARSYIKEHGYGEYLAHGVGHSLGLEVHDPFDQGEPFAEGNVVTDEPGIYIPGLGGVRIEDVLVVTRKGAEQLTTAPYLSL